MPPELEESVEDITNSGGEAHEQDPAAGGAPAAADPNKEMRDAIASLAGTVTKLATPTVAPVAKTSDQLAEEFGIFDPKKADPRFFQDFFGLPDDVDPKILERKVALFAAMQKGLATQAVKTAIKLMRENDLSKMREEYTPATSFASEARAERTRTRFYDSFPSLRDSDADGPKFSGVINAVAQQLADKEFADEAAYFKALAEGAAATIRGVIPTFDLGAKPTAKPTAGTTPRLPRTSVGGNGGAGNGNRAPAKSTTDDDSGSIEWT